jgi:hypothetical protein
MTNHLHIQKPLKDIEELESTLNVDVLKDYESISFSCWTAKRPNWDGQVYTSKRQIICYLNSLSFNHDYWISSAKNRSRLNHEDEMFFFNRVGKIRTAPTIKTIILYFIHNTRELTKIIIKLLQSIKRYLAKEIRYNNAKATWKSQMEKEIAKLYPQQTSKWKPYTFLIDAVAQHDDTVIAFVKPWYYPLIGKLIQKFGYEVYANVGQKESHNNEDIFFLRYPGRLRDIPATIEKIQKEKCNKKGVIVQAHFFNDFMFLEPWLNHYRRQGALHFMLYYNGRRLPDFLLNIEATNGDVSLFHWPLRYSYRNSVLGKPDYHYGQISSFQHAQFTCDNLNLGSHILFVDLDEYVIGNPSLDKLANDQQNTEFANCWAINPPGIFGVKRKHTKVLANKFDVTSKNQKKQLKPIRVFEPIYNHGLKNDSYISAQHALIHFGNQVELNCVGLNYKPKIDFRDLNAFQSLETLDANELLAEIFNQFEKVQKKS